jgi:hypothetical protein
MNHGFLLVERREAGYQGVDRTVPIDIARADVWPTMKHPHLIGLQPETSPIEQLAALFYSLGVNDLEVVLVRRPGNGGSQTLQRHSAIRLGYDIADPDAPFWSPLGDIQAAARPDSPKSLNEYGLFDDASTAVGFLDWALENLDDMDGEFVVWELFCLPKFLT